MKCDFKCESCVHAHSIEVKSPVNDSKYFAGVCLKSMQVISPYDFSMGFEAFSCIGQNPDNECKLYKKRWWLFWIK